MLPPYEILKRGKSMPASESQVMTLLTTRVAFLPLMGVGWPIQSVNKNMFGKLFDGQCHRFLPDLVLICLRFFLKIFVFKMPSSIYINFHRKVSICFLKVPMRLFYHAKNSKKSSCSI